VISVLSRAPVPKEVEISSAGRLHFGFLDVFGSLGRRFGSVGLSISGPAIRVRARFASGLSVDGSDGENVKSALKYAAMFYERPEICEIIGNSQRAGIFLDETIPPHRGFGAGTQLALSVALSLCRLHGLACSPAEAAEITGRGLRSGIGIEAFAAGGFIVDAGAPQGERVPPLAIFRANFPERWRAVTVLPPDSAEGLSGAGERRAFAGMPAPECSPAREICHIVLMKLLPALLEKKLSAFGEAVQRVQELTGEIFAPFQSGRFASPMAEEIFKKMRELGAVGMGQSSWGPLLYCFADGERDAAAVASGIEKYFSGSEALCGGELTAGVVSGRNRGAVIRTRRLK
jgi:beta-RFAP synthase